MNKKIETDNFRELLVLASFHKPYIYNSASTWLRPCAVGQFQSNDPLIFSDNSGNNISALNPYFCELTAMYWAWKNISGVDKIGFCHYRRYFYLGSEFYSSQRVPFVDLNSVILEMSGPQAKERALALLEHADAIVPQAFYLGGSIDQEYQAHHLPEHWAVFKSVLFDHLPHYRRYAAYFEHSNRFIFCNMMIWHWQFFDRYCSELFPILFEVHARCPVPKDSYQARYLGFLAERFLMFFCYANGLRLAEVPLVGFENNA